MNKTPFDGIYHALWFTELHFLIYLTFSNPNIKMWLNPVHKSIQMSCIHCYMNDAHFIAQHKTPDTILHVS